MLLPGSRIGMTTAMDDMNLIQQAQRHHLLGEEIDLEMGHGDDAVSFANTPLMSGTPQEPSAEEHDDPKDMGMGSQLPNQDQDMSRTQPAKRKKKIVKRWREEWADTYRWAYVDMKEGTARIFCSICREYGRKHRRNPYGNEGSRNMQMNALEEHNNSLLHKEALRLQMASKDKIVVDKPIYVKAALKRDPHEAEFIQSVQEVVRALERVIAKNAHYVNIMERLLEPGHIIIFRVPWGDDRGKTHVNRGYRVQFNQALGPCKGGLRFHPLMNLSIVRFLGLNRSCTFAIVIWMKSMDIWVLTSYVLGSPVRGNGCQCSRNVFGQYRHLAGNFQVIAEELELNHECNLMHWSPEDFESKLQGFHWQEAMKQICQRALKAGSDFVYQKESPEALAHGAVIASFLTIAQAMTDQGCV